MGSNAIIAIVVGAIVVIVGFSLWPVLNGASNNLYSYFRDSCDDGSGNRFLKVYAEVSGTTEPGDNEYNSETGIHGGPGVGITANTTTKTLCRYAALSSISAASGATIALYNEQGNAVANGVAVVTAGVVTGDLSTPNNFVAVAEILRRFSGINNLLLTILPVISIAGFLGISGAKLYSYGKGASNIGSAISTSIFTLIAIVVAMVIAGPIMGSLVDANQVVSSGQYQVNSAFGNIISLLFSMIPIIYVAGLVTLVGLQAKSALMGNKSGGSSMM